MVSISEMLSVICREEIHLCDGCMHLMVYQWRPRQMADVRSFQSQLHSANGRSASGDRISLPLSSMSEALWINTVQLSAKCSGTVPTSNRNLQALKRNCEPSLPPLPPPPHTSVSAIWYYIGTRCRIFKFGPTNGPMDVVRSLVNIS